MIKAKFENRKVKAKKGKGVASLGLRTAWLSNGYA